MIMTDAGKRRPVDEDSMKPRGASRMPGYANWWPGGCLPAALAWAGTSVPVEFAPRSVRY